jgi:signal transduction histidine kinase
MTDGEASSLAARRHLRHSGAKWPRGLSLRARLSLLVALVIAAVVTALTVLQVRATERTIEQTLVDAARLTAEAVADDLRGRDAPLDADDLRGTLHEFIEANPAVRAISVVTFTDGGFTLLASTSTEVRAEAVSAARRAIDSGRPAMDRSELTTIVAVPAGGHWRRMGVVTTVSMEAVRQARTQGRTNALLFALPVIVLLTGFVDLLARQLVHRPVSGILATMRRAADGNLAERAAVARRDELGSIAEGLNDLLARIERFNEALQDRVRGATDELRLRNAELEQSYERVLSLGEALARAERVAALGQMAASVAHQVGTPLNLVSGYVQMIREDPAIGPQVGQRLDIVDRQIQQVTRVLRTMLDQVRQPSPRETTSLARLIDRACETARPRLERPGVTLNVRVDPALPPVEADAAQLELALLNLITNSLDAMPHGGALTITAAGAADRVRLEVADTGPGIAADVLPRVFEPWVTTKSVGQGSGLGLSIVRDVVRAHGGTISVRNGDHGGAILTIELPRAAVAGAAVHA